MKDFITDARVSEEWFSILARPSIAGGDDRWFTKEEFKASFREAGEKFDGKAVEQFDSGDGERFDAALAISLAAFMQSRLMRHRGRQTFTPNLKLRHPFPTPELQLTELGKSLYRAPSWVRFVFFLGFWLFDAGRSTVKRWWWAVGIAAAGSQLHKALDLFGVAAANVSGWLAHLVGLLVGAIVGWLLRRLLDTFR